MTADATLRQMVKDTVERMLPGLVRGMDTALGTLVTRTSDGLTGTVVFDGSEVAIPVKVSGAIPCNAGDRVGLVRTGGYWMVVGVLSVRGMGEASRSGLGASSLTTTSSSYADMGNVAALTLVKGFDATAVQVAYTGSFFALTSSATVRVGARVIGPKAVDGTTYDSGDFDVSNLLINNAGQHLFLAGDARIIPPAGTFTVQMRWRRVSGSGTVSQDTNDWYSVTVDEIRRQS